MTDSARSRAVRTPVHLWIVGIILLLWNAMGAVDYTMTQTKNEAYMSKFTEAQLAYFYGFPAWVDATWALAVWGALLGTVLLLLRSRFAVPVYLVSLVAMVATTIHNYGLSDGMEVAGDPFSLVFSGVIFLLAVAQVVYARLMCRRGVLK